MRFKFGKGNDLYELKKMKNTSGREGDGLICEVHKNGKLYFTYADYGDGGMADVDPRNVREEFDKVVEGITYEFYGTTGNHNTETIVSEMEMVTRLAKKCKTQTLIQKKADLDNVLCLKAPYSEGVKKAIFTKYKPEDITILNELYSSDVFVFKK